jgi:hypothetical protein
MTKTTPEIDDQMIKRGMDALVFHLHQICGPDSMRAILTAALTEPEIEVTEAMKFAGCQAYANEAYGGNSKPSEWMMVFVTNIYRAMVKAAPNRCKCGAGPNDGHAMDCAPKGAKSAAQGVNAGAPEEATVGGVGLGWRSHERKGDMGFVWHRRTTDPKPQRFYGMTRD